MGRETPGWCCRPRWSLTPPALARHNDRVRPHPRCAAPVSCPQARRSAQAVLDGKGTGGGVVDGAQVRLDGEGRQDEALRRLRIAQAFGDDAQDLGRARGQPERRRGAGERGRRPRSAKTMRASPRRYSASSGLALGRAQLGARKLREGTLVGRHIARDKSWGGPARVRPSLSFSRSPAPDQADWPR